MASPSNSSQNGGILGVSNNTSFGKCKVTEKTSNAPSAVTTQPGTRFVDTLVVAGGGGGGSTSGGAGGGGGAGGVRAISNIPVCGNTALGAVVIGGGGAADTSGADSTLTIGCTTYTSESGGRGSKSFPSYGSDAATGGSGGGGQGYTNCSPSPSRTGAAGNTPPTTPLSLDRDWETF
jgi:hypothetical protein